MIVLVFQSKEVGVIMTRKILLTTILCVFFASFAIAQQPGEVSYKDDSVLPTGKKGERIQAIIDTLNSDNPESIRRFMEKTASNCRLARDNHHGVLGHRLRSLE